MAQVRAAMEGAAAAGDEACLTEAVAFRRFGMDEPRPLSLTYCDGRANPDALNALRELARPPLPAGADAASEDTAPPLNPELLPRLQLLAAQFPGRPFEIISGNRTRGRSTSRHRSGDALDLRIEGVDNADLSAFARTLEATGVGYYPNSTFVHIDVRPSSAYWVDISAPGKKPNYVRPAPDPRLASVLLSDPDAHEPHGAELPIGDDEPVESDSEPAPATDPAAVADSATDSEPAAGAESVADSETAARPASDASPQELDAELRAICDRALAVMRAAQAG